MLDRVYAKDLLAKLASFPVVTVLGARQCGKTTLVREALKDWSYFDMERPSHRTAFEEDPEGRLREVGQRVVLDEAQQVPGLFPVLRSFVDERRQQMGQYVLLGSASPSLVRSISETLAGRTAFVEMTPFLWSEVAAVVPGVRAGDLWLRGGFPDAFLARDDAVRHDWLEGYARTFIERDLSSLGIEVSPALMRRLWTMLAHVNGGFWNASSIASSLGVSYHTVNRYVEILEQTFLVRRLPPYHANIGKRLVKSPKLLFRDTGLLHYFLGIHCQEELSVRPERGASWEAFICEQLITLSALRRPGTQAWCWRTSAGAEVDLLLDGPGGLVPVEVKLHSAPGTDAVRGLRACMGDLGLKRGVVVSGGQESYALADGVRVMPAGEALGNVERIHGSHD